MIVHISREENRRPNREELEHVIKRNFSGLVEDGFDPVEIIMRHVVPGYYGVKIIIIYIYTFVKKTSTRPLS